MTGDDGAARVQAVHEVPLAVVDNVEDIAAQAPGEARICQEPTSVGVELVDQPASQERSRQELRGQDTLDLDIQPRQRVAELMSVQSHAHLPCLAIVVKQADVKASSRVSHRITHHAPERWFPAGAIIG